jgi:hypothetical protein
MGWVNSLGLTNLKSEKAQNPEGQCLRADVVSLLEMKSVVFHFQGKLFNHGHLLVYQVADVGGGPTDKGT